MIDPLIDDVRATISPPREENDVEVLRANIRKLKEERAADQAQIAKLKGTQFDGLMEKMVAHGLKAATFKAASDGRILMANTYAETLCGPVFEQGGNLFSLVIDRLRYPSGIPSEDSGVTSSPLTFGRKLRQEMAATSQVTRLDRRARRPSEGFEPEYSVMEQLIYESHEGPVRVLMAMSYVRDHNEHPWIQLTLVNLDAVNRDDLTGLWRRGTFDNVLVRKVDERLRLYEHAGFAAPLTLLMIDIDHFKKVNDTHGHQGGDDALKVVSRRILRIVQRNTDMVCRYGGEEIAVILDAGRVEAEQIAQRILNEVRKTDTVVRTECGQTAIKLTVSIGGTVFLNQGDTASKMVSRADLSLYEAKGKNQSIWTRPLGRPTSRNRTVFDGQVLPDPDR